MATKKMTMGTKATRSERALVVAKSPFHYCPAKRRTDGASLCNGLVSTVARVGRASNNANLKENQQVLNSNIPTFCAYFAP
jgi:hypothetical protein